MANKSINKLRNWGIDLGTKIHIWIHSMLTSTGAYLLRLGALHQPGEPIPLKAGLSPSLSMKAVFNRRKSECKYVRDIKYSFLKNKIEYVYSDKPIPGLSDPFIKERELKNRMEEWKAGKLSHEDYIKHFGTSSVRKAR